MDVGHESFAGYGVAPFARLVAEYPGEEVYPIEDFRVEWGPIFHRGRLDGSARLLVLGQDPAAHEAISRRILAGEAGQRVQGLLARIGITSSYVMLNVFLYSVFGQRRGNRRIEDEAIAGYRGRWLDALLVGTQVTAVVTFGTLAAKAYAAWTATQPETAAAIHVATVTHPTYPESAARAGRPLAETTAAMLEQWSAALPGLVEHVVPDHPFDPSDQSSPGRPYAADWQDGDLVAIPEGGLPAGAPIWWRDLDQWAARTGADSQTKRATITVAVPKGARTWPPL